MCPVTSLGLCGVSLSKVGYVTCLNLLFFFKQKTAYEMRISDWSSDVCSSDLASSVSAAGGAPDFARAAKTSRSGLSIIALPATAARGTASRIVGQMGNQIGRASCRERVCQYV